jgi:hypothetical protein
MIEQTFIESNLKKIEKLFLEKKISIITTLLDEDDDLIDNAIYIKIENEYLGIYINGTNPFFSKSFIENIDMFNLYENYNQIKTDSKKITEFKIDSIKIVFNSDYNELLGLYFSNSTIEESSFSIIFMSDELDVLEDYTFEDYKNKIDNNLLHIENKKTFSIDVNHKKWVMI